jgi:hypothetical protein
VGDATAKVNEADARLRKAAEDETAAKHAQQEAAAAASFSPAQSGEKTPEEACQAQALASIATKWPKVLKGQFEIVLKDNRCLVLLQAPVVIERKRMAWLVDGTNGEVLAEFTAPTRVDGWKDSDRGLCSYRGGKFKTGECTWGEYLDNADQM